MAASKRQMTAAKKAREQALREKRSRKQEKKEARRLAAAEGTTLDEYGELAFDEDGFPVTLASTSDETPAGDAEPAPGSA